MTYPDRMDNLATIHFRDQFRVARARVLEDAEDFDAVVRAMETLGRFLDGRGRGLYDYRECLGAVARRSPLAVSVPTRQANYHLAFEALFDSVRIGRNMAIHEGAVARRLATHSIECALILEDALVANMTSVGDFMVRSPVVAAPWHPLSFVRQAMLTGSFSFLPVSIPEVDAGAWRLVSDVVLARALRPLATRNDRLAMPLREAVLHGIVGLDTPKLASADDKVEAVAADLTYVPVLVVGSSPAELLGILTAFDLL